MTLNFKFYSSEASFLLLHARIKKLTVCLDVCPDVRIILVLVWKNCLGFSVRSGYRLSLIHI